MNIAHRLQLFCFIKIDFRARPTDIFIASYPRSGTTWLQMILYQLCTTGEMNFTHISEKCPFFERKFRSIGYGQKILAKGESAERRIFKTHLSYDMVPQGDCKYIYIIRNGMDVAVSYFHFYRSHVDFLGGEFEGFSKKFMSKSPDLQYGSWFDHVSAWLGANDPRVLILRYEDLHRDLRNNCIRIAEFCDIQIDSEKLSRVLERSAFAFMKQHEEKFDYITELLVESGAQSGKFLREGKSGSGETHLTDKQKERFMAVLEKWPRVKAFCNR
jgi:hypothetical protein